MKSLKTQINELRNNQEGFTLIELLIVIVIIAALAVTVFAALNPVKRVKDAHDSRRAADVESILSSIHEYIVDKNGTLPWNTTTYPTTSSYMLGTCAAGCTNNTVPGTTTYSPSAGNSFQCGASAPSYAPAVSNTPALDLSSNLATYLKSMPFDPLGGGYGAANTGYAVSYNASNQITVFACLPEDTTSGSIYQSR